MIKITVKLILGFAVGFVHSGVHTLKCIPNPNQLDRTDIRTKFNANTPTLTPARFSLQEVTSAIPLNRNDKVVACALCHAKSAEMVNTSN